MNKFNKRSLLISIVCFLFSSTSVSAQTIQEASINIISPIDNQKGLNNPDMGWYYYKYDNNPDKYGTRFPDNETFEYWEGMTTAYYRIAWGHLEPKKGEYRWDLIENSAKHWIAAGKQICFRITALEGYEGATPDWVGTGYDPENPIFLEALDNFLKAFAERYDGKPYVAHIDIGSIGIWGEGHHGCSDSVRINHIDMHLKHFKKSLLVISDDMRAEVCAYARKRGVSIRDDSVMWHEKLFPSQVSFDLYWPTMPTIIETCHYGSITGGKNPWGKKHGWSDIALLATIEEYHASWVSVHGWADDFWKERQACIKAANLRMGYRLQITEIKYPKQVNKGNQIAFEMKWRNAAVAPCYKGGFVTITLKDKNGKIVLQGCNPDFNVKTLQPGLATVFGEINHCDVILNIPSNLKNGKYTIFVSVGEKNKTPIYQLPYESEDGSKRYLFGDVLIL